MSVMLEVELEVRKLPRYEDDCDNLGPVLKQLSPAARKRWHQEAEIFFELVPEYYPKYGEDMIFYVADFIDEILGPFTP